jgi:ABC-type multidrug transport system fused ATPase/permease subunit
VSEGHAGPAAAVSGLRAVSRGTRPGRRPGAGFLRPMRPYFRQVAGLLVIGSLAGIVMNTAVVLPSVLLGHAVDTVLAYRRGQAPGSAVTTAALLLIGGSAATELPRVGKRWWLGVARTRIRASVRADALRGVLSWPAHQLHVTSVGEVMARIIGDVEVLGTGVGEVITETWDTLLFSVSLAVAMFAYDPALAALALVPVPFALALARLAGTRVSRRTLRARQASADLTAFVQEGLAGVRVLHASGRRAAWTGRMSLLASAQADRPGPARVTVEDAVLTYPGAARPALNGVSLTAGPGSLVAVTGPVGSGKTALARAVLGLYPVQGGQVRVDGADPHAWTPAQRGSIGYLPQGHPVFSGSIASNVLLTGSGAGSVPPEAAERLAGALRVASLDADVAGMADGPDTGIGELGVRISGGQRQRLALARALAAPATPPRLLVLDDPFSAVDAGTEARIIAALREAVGPQAPPEHQATVLLCSTRLAAFACADEVIVLEGGRVRERGTHSELLAAAGLYGRIFLAQQRGHATEAVQP